MSTLAAVARAALTGAATGCRSQLPMAACAVSGPSASGRVESWLDSTPGRRVHVAAAAGEFVGDLLPKAPARTELPGLLARLGLGALAASVLARRHGEPEILAAAVGLATAAVTTFAGPPARAAASRRAGSDLPGALAEDVAAVGLVAVAVRLR